jgi:hypothetical protein
MPPVETGSAVPRPPQSVPLVRISQTPVGVQPLGEFLGVWLHWRPDLGPKGETVPHAPRGCRECARGVLREGFGFAAALEVCLQTGAVREAVLIVSGLNRCDFAPPVAGRFFELARHPKGSARPLAVRPRPDVHRDAPPPTFDLLRQVARLKKVLPEVIAAAAFDWATADLSPATAAAPRVDLALARELAAAAADEGETTEDLARGRAIIKAAAAGDQDLVAKLCAEADAAKAKRTAEPVSPPVVRPPTPARPQGELVGDLFSVPPKLLPTSAASAFRTARPRLRRNGGAR